MMGICKAICKEVSRAVYIRKGKQKGGVPNTLGAGQPDHSSECSLARLLKQG